MAALPYLTRRDSGRYYIQIRLPPGPAWPSLLRLSLQTSDPKVARHSLCNALAWLMPFRDAESLTRQAEEVLAQCRRFTRAGPAASWHELEDRKRFEQTFSAFAHEVRHFNVPDEVRLPLLSDWAFFTDMLHRDEMKLYEASGEGRRLTVSPASPPAQSQPTPDDEASNEAPEPNAAPTARGRRSRRKASAVLAEFLAEERQSSGHDGAYGDVGIYVEFMIALLGDRPMAGYVDEDFTKLGTELAHIPNRTGVPRASAKSLWSRYQYAKEHGWAGLSRLSETTLKNRYKTGLDRFLAFAMKRKDLSKKVRVTVVLSDENFVALPRDSFTDEEIEQILKMPTFTGCEAPSERWRPGSCLIQDHIYWGYIIMLLTGMRTSEVGQLLVKDILEEDGIYFFNLQPFDPSGGRVARRDVRQLKTGNSARSIPLDLLIIDLGFLDRLRALLAVGEARLFPEWECYQKLSGKVIWDRPLTRDWQYRRKKLELERKNISLYSSRHAFGDRLDKAEVPQRIRDRLMGHAPTSAKGRYGSKRPADPELAAVLQKLETPVVKRMRAILLPPYERALAGDGVALTEPSWVQSG